ncbi:MULTISPECIES: type I restriction-modification system subunit M N-terminal domain-containing protein [Phocaeicola]|uniref:type I restriction-modification system subunit M N-terminal domain-containing protein n=1 Tax=Phocaeicola TaxID=909656 RepID=UPI0021A9F7F9|nr:MULTISPECIES: type I restriction-modification system subunit M N-terminal domain-containing protein [Phocaeicola]
MAKKKATKKEENSLNLETILFNCRDYLRGSASLNDKRDVILTLVFLRFIGEKFDDAQAEMRQQCINRGITDEEKIARFLDSPLSLQKYSICSRSCSLVDANQRACI